MRKSVWLTALTLVSATGAMGTAVASEHPMDTSALVKSVMDETYGQTFDGKNACWRYAWKDSQGESTDYCMRAGPAKIIEAGGRKTLYFNTFSAADIQGDTHFLYSQDQPGLMGAFKVTVGGPQGWTYDAYDAAIDYGTAGDCGCSKAEFVKLSDAGHYGWLFTSGGTWQGVTVADYSIVTDIKGRMKDVSKIPRVTEKNQGVVYSVSVRQGNPTMSMYALHVVKTVNGGHPSEFDVAFDTVKAIYALPAGQ